MFILLEQTCCSKQIKDVKIRDRVSIFSQQTPSVSQKYKNHTQDFVLTLQEIQVPFNTLWRFLMYTFVMDIGNNICDTQTIILRKSYYHVEMWSSRVVSLKHILNGLFTNSELRNMGQFA